MPFFDFPLDQLREYKPDVKCPGDFEEFWTQTLAESPGSAPLAVDHVDAQFSGISVFDVTIPGFEGEPVKAWFLRPENTQGPVPLIVEFAGYGGGRGLPEEHLTWPTLGYAVLVVDTRGQGGQWGSGGDTVDSGPTGPSSNGFMTRGIQSPETYYYRRVFTDAANALATARQLPGVDHSKVVASGGSQGAGIALAASALDKLRNPEFPVAGVMANVPFLSNFERAVGLTGGYPYQEIVDFLAVNRDQVDQVFDTLSYFDAVNMAKRIDAPSQFSVGLMDQITPPSTVFAAHNWIGGPSEIEVYPFNGHESGGTYQLRKQRNWLGRLFGSETEAKD